MATGIMPLDLEGASLTLSVLLDTPSSTCVAVEPAEALPKFCEASIDSAEANEVHRMDMLHESVACANMNDALQPVYLLVLQK